MSNEEPNITFDTDTESGGNTTWTAVKYYKETTTPALIKSVMKYSGVKSERQAEYLLLAFAVLMFGSSIYFFFFFGKAPSGQTSVPILPPGQMQNAISQ